VYVTGNTVYLKHEVRGVTSQVTMAACVYLTKSINRSVSQSHQARYTIKETTFFDKCTVAALQQL